MFKSELKSSTEIAEYISGLATDYVDEVLLLEYFFNCKGILKKVTVGEIELDNSDIHIQSKRKEKRYATLPPDTMPPLIVENGVVVDGNHRLRVARKRKQTEIYIYEIIPLRSTKLAWLPRLPTGPHTAMAFTTLVVAV